MQYGPLLVSKPPEERLTLLIQPLLVQGSPLNFFQGLLKIYHIIFNLHDFFETGYEYEDGTNDFVPIMLTFDDTNYLESSSSFGDKGN